MEIPQWKLNKMIAKAIDTPNCKGESKAYLMDEWDEKQWRYTRWICITCSNFHVEKKLIIPTCPTCGHITID